jgi:hypothetical protein
VPPAASTVDYDLPCAQCGYNLRTLAHASRCPECATPVAVSLAPNPMAHADPAKLRRVRAGLLLSVASALLATTVPAVAYREFWWAGVVGLFPGGNKACLVIPATISALDGRAPAVVLVAVALLTHWAAAWLVSTRFLPAYPRPPAEGLREAYRWTAGITALALPLGWFALDHGVTPCVALFCLVGDVAQLFVFTAYARALARFAGHGDLAGNLGLALTALWISLGSIVGIPLCLFSEDAAVIPILAGGIIYAGAALITLVTIARLAARLAQVRTLRP